MFVNERLNAVTELANKNDADLALENLIQTMHDAKNRSVPLVSKNSKFIRVSPDTKRAIAERNSLKRQWQRCPYANLKRQLKSQINELNRRIGMLVNHNRNHKWNETLKKLETGAKKFWNLCKTIKGKYAGAIYELMVDDRSEFTNSGKANALANAFETAHTLTQGLISPIERKVRAYKDNLNTTVDYDVPDRSLITTTEIKDIIRRLKNSKAPGIDGITNVLIKKLPERALKVLENIFNWCLKNGYFPNRFKTAKIKAIPKPGKDHRNPVNYRPISLLSCIGILLEKLIHCRLPAHVEENNIKNPEQFGFRIRNPIFLP